MPRPLALVVLLLLAAAPAPGVAAAAVSPSVPDVPVAALPPGAGAGADAPRSVPDLAGATSASARVAGSWRWPVPAPHPIVRPYVAPATPYASGHRGIDIGAVGPEVFAPAGGVVSFAGVVVDRPVLSIRHPGGVVSSYEPVLTELVAGDPVSVGQLIGTLLPGHCAALCLHFGVRVGGQYVSPLLFLGDIPPSVLLPTRR